MTDEHRTRLRRILDEHDRIAAELQESNDAIRQAAEHTREAVLAVHNIAVRVEDASAAGNRAIAAMLAANRAALALLNEDAQP